MMQKTISFTLAALLTVGCTGQLLDRDDRGDGDGGTEFPGSWGLSVDTSASDTYLPMDTATATIRGHVTASEGVERVEVGPETSPSRVPVDSGGAFTVPMSVDPGYSLVEVRAYDRNGNMVRGNHSVLRSTYTPEWERLGDSAVIAADDALLSGLAAGASGVLGMLDLSAFIMPGAPLMESSTCHLYVDNVSHSPPTLGLSTTEDGHLRATARVSDITVGFSGNCNALGQSIQVRPGSEADETTVEISMTLQANETLPGECVHGFTSADVNLSITSFDLDLRLAGCGLLCLFGEVIGEIAEGAVRGMIEDRFRGMVGGLIDPLLADLTVLDETRTIDFLMTPVDVNLCLTGLDTVDGQLLASLGTRVRGPGGLGLEAPGAAILPTTLPTTAAPGTLLIDPGLVSQILFSVWNGGAFAIPDVSALSGGAEGLGFTIDTLSGVVPQLRALISDGTIMRGAPLVIGVDAQMAPLVRAANAEEAAAGVDMFIELGDLRLSLGTASMTLFEIGTHVSLALTLEPTAEGALAPVLVASESRSTTWLIDTAVAELPARNADSLTDLVNGLVLTSLAPLLSGAAIELPDLGVPLEVGDVSPTDGGYLAITLGAGGGLVVAPIAP